MGDLPLPSPSLENRMAKQAPDTRNTTPIPALEPEKKKKDAVQEASEQSFPASDPPSHGAPKQSAPVCEPKPAAPTPKKQQTVPDKVDEASEESFPASDPPGGTSHA
jgi:hypothetical protein